MAVIFSANPAVFVLPLLPVRQRPRPVASSSLICLLYEAAPLLPSFFGRIGVSFIVSLSNCLSTWPTGETPVVPLLQRQPTQIVYGSVTPSAMVS